MAAQQDNLVIITLLRSGPVIPRLNVAYTVFLEVYFIVEMQGGRKYRKYFINAEGKFKFSDHAVKEGHKI